MKTKITLICLLIAISFASKAQTYVTIPDAHFVSWLTANIPSAMNGSLMDTSSTAVTTLTYMNIENNSIADLTGIQYFHSLISLDCGNGDSTLTPNTFISLPSLPVFLETLICGNDSLTSLPTLPITLNVLECYQNKLTSLPVLPDSLTILDCHGNQLTSLPALPIMLSSLYCGMNQLTSLPVLPDSLIQLSCEVNQLPSLPALPNSLTVINCGNNQLTSLPALPNSLSDLICSYNQLTNLPVLPGLLSYLACSGNQLPSLTTLPNSLLNLICSYNQLISLPVLPGLLSYLDCGGNQLTSLPTLPGSLEFLNCNSNPLSILPVLPGSLADLYCEYDLLSNLPTLPTSLSLLDCSNNSITSLPSLSALNSLLCGYNLLTGLPILPVTISYLFCDGNQLTSLPVLPDYLTGLRCGNNMISCFPVFPASLTDTNNFFIAPNPFGCLPNYVSAMLPGTLAYPLCVSGDTINNSHGCAGSGGIAGYAFQDNNINCTKDSGDFSLANIPLKSYDISNNPLSQTYSLMNGIYNFPDTAGMYVVKIDTAGMPFQAQCVYPGIDSTVSLTTGNPLAPDVNFAIGCKLGFDVGVQSVVPDGWIFPGRLHSVNIVAGDLSRWYHLNCAAGVGGTVQVTVTGPVTYYGAASGALTPTIAGNVFTYPVTDFGAINNSIDFGLLFTTDITAQAGDQICVDVNVTPANGDNDLTNNAYQFCYQVVNSHDPNMKEVYPVDLSYGYHNWLTYTVHFQNTGTAPAANIRLVDTLDNNLDFKSFQVINYSHSNTASLEGDILTFRFPNIMLPDSASNPEGSKGFVQYRIKPKTNLPFSTQIKNTANIYFDYNPPIKTNTTTNKFMETVSVNENKRGASLSIYPNPGNGTYFVKLTEGVKNSETTIKVYNLLGELIVNTKTNNNSCQIDLGLQPNGVYTIRLNNNNQSFNQRLIKQ